MNNKDFNIEKAIKVRENYSERGIVKGGSEGHKTVAPIRSGPTKPPSSDGKAKK